MKIFRMKESLDKSLFKNNAIAHGDRKPIALEVRELKYLHTTHESSTTVENDAAILDSASDLFGALAQLFACGPEIRVHKAIHVDDQVEETDNKTVRKSSQESEKGAEQVETELIAKAEQIFSKEVKVQSSGLNEIIYILPYRHAGVWHCVLRSSASILVISVSWSEEIKVIDGHK